MSREDLEKLQHILGTLKSRHVKGCAHVHERLMRALLPLADLNVLTNGQWKRMPSWELPARSMYTSTHTQQAFWWRGDLYALDI